MTLALAAACTSEQVGSPTPSGGGGGTTTEAPGSDTTKPTKPTTSSASPADSLKPCELLTPAAASAVGATGSPTKETIGGFESCRWRVDKGSIADSYILGVVVLDRVGLDDITADGPVQRIKVGSRNAAQSTGPGAVCAISLELTAKSRVDVQASGGDAQKLCVPVLEAAKLVEAELP
ncbi:DUF3558 family protein [Actinokineospora diospyrosa]|nr:DUF3558 family protein [Actinokineospora diospyrosa]